MKASTLLMTAALCSAASTAQGQQVVVSLQNVSGAITFAEHAKIPKGELKLFLRETSQSHSKIELKLQDPLKSSGTVKSYAFMASLPKTLHSVTPLQLIAQLERSDGWLIARGSVLVSNIKAQQNITLFPVMY